MFIRAQVLVGRSWPNPAMSPTQSTRAKKFESVPLSERILEIKCLALIILCVYPSCDGARFARKEEQRGARMADQRGVRSAALQWVVASANVRDPQPGQAELIPVASGSMFQLFLTDEDA